MLQLKINPSQPSNLFCIGLGKHYFNNKKKDKISEQQNPSCAQLCSSLHPHSSVARTWVNKENIIWQPHENRLGSAVTLTMSDS